MLFAAQLHLSLLATCFSVIMLVWCIGLLPDTCCTCRQTASSSRLRCSEKVRSERQATYQAHNSPLQRNLNCHTFSGTEPAVFPACKSVCSRYNALQLQVHGSPVQGDSLTTVAGDSLDREPALQTPDYDQLAKDLDMKSPLEIMDQVCNSHSHSVLDYGY